MLLCLHNRNSRAKLLKTEEADESLNITENKTNYITDISSRSITLDLGLVRFSTWEFFSEYF